MLFFLIPLACNWSSTAAPAVTVTGTQPSQPNVSITRYSPDYSSGETTQTPFVPETTLEPALTGQPAGGETISPEEVVYTVLTNHDTNPDWVQPYLSDKLWEALPSGGVTELLGLEGDLEGLVFQAGSTSADPNLAYVEAALQANGMQTYRIFTLVRSDSGWQIDSIEMLEPE